MPGERLSFESVRVAMGVRERVDLVAVEVAADRADVVGGGAAATTEHAGAGVEPLLCVVVP